MGERAPGSAWRPGFEEKAFGPSDPGRPPPAESSPEARPETRGGRGPQGSSPGAEVRERPLQAGESQNAALDAPGLRSPQDVGRRPVGAEPQINTCGSAGRRRWSPPPGRAELDRSRGSSPRHPCHPHPHPRFPSIRAFASSPSVPLFPMSNPGRPGKAWGWSAWGPREPRPGSSGRLPHPRFGMRIAAALVVEASAFPDASATSSPPSSASPAPAAAWLRLSLSAPASCHRLLPGCQQRGAGRGLQTRRRRAQTAWVGGRPGVLGPARE